ncbi:MAG: hypothetical protein IJ744_08805 [Lachnospiraceae bacterium]|nr:hypothetical protein [Lachnospiraceae bacterium]
MKWVTAYGASQCGNRMYRLNVAGRTFRTLVKLPFGGEKIRLILSSTYGGKLFVGAMSVKCGETICPVTLRGEASFVIGKNERVLSDEIALRVSDGDEIEIRTYFSKGVCMTGLWQTTTYSTIGNFTRGEFQASEENLWRSKKRPLDIGIPFPLVSGIDVYTPYEDAEAVAIFGASNEFIGRWVEPVRQMAAEKEPHLSLLNVSISGNRLLKDTGNKLLLGDLFGDGGLKRFSWDVLGYAGVKTMIVCVGANDIHQPGTFACYRWEKLPNAEAMKQGMLTLIGKAHQAGIRVIGTTITPLKNSVGCTKEKLALRREVNEWIMTSGAFDDVFDLADALTTKEEPEALTEAFNSGDFLHFTAAGGLSIAEKFPVELLRG